MRDPYEVLGVDRSATEADIRGAFRKLAARHHPDRNPDDPAAQQRFQELNAAFQLLGDPEKRAAFDRFGPELFERAAGGAGPEYVDLGALGLDGLFGDLLGALGIRTGDRGDLRERVRLSFEEAALGCTREVTYTRLDRCGRCAGTAAEPGARVDPCATCGGRGRIRLQGPMLPVALERTCPACRGAGRIPTRPCVDCSGRGVSRSERTLEVSFPPGVEAGATKRVEGAGNRTRPDRPPGDLELVVEVAPHPFFTRDGDDLVCSVPVPFTLATLGGEVETPSLEGKVLLRVPPGTQPGTVLRLRGKGVPHRFRSGTGDQLVEIRVEVPRDLSPRARELIEHLARELGEDVPTEHRGLLDRLKGLFE